MQKAKLVSTWTKCWGSPRVASAHPFITTRILEAVWKWVLLDIIALESKRVESLFLIHTIHHNKLNAKKVNSGSY